MEGIIMSTKKNKKKESLAQVRKAKEESLFDTIYVDVDDMLEGDSGEYFSSLNGLSNGARIAVFKLAYIGTAKIDIIKTQKIIKDKE